jgi:hypothetical protein
MEPWRDISTLEMVTKQPRPPIARLCPSGNIVTSIPDAETVLHDFVGEEYVYVRLIQTPEEIINMTIEDVVYRPTADNILPDDDDGFFERFWNRFTISFGGDEDSPGWFTQLFENLAWPSMPDWLRDWTWPSLPRWEWPSMPDWLINWTWPSLADLEWPLPDWLIEWTWPPLPSWEWPIPGWLNSIVSLPGLIADSITEVFENIRDTIIYSITAFFIDFDWLDFLIGLIVPSESFWEEWFDHLAARLSERLPYQTYINTIGLLRNVGSPHVPFDISIESDSITPIAMNANGLIDTSNAQSVVSGMFNLMRPFLDPIRTLLYGLYFLLLAYYNYKQIYFLIRGTSFFGVGHTISDEVS